MNFVDILFSSEWVTVLFIAMLITIARKLFVLPKTFKQDQFTRALLIKRQEERRYVEIYG